MLEYFDGVKRDRTGISSDAQGLSPDALKNIQTSVLAASVDMSRMKIEAIARIFAETGIKSLFMHIHELLLKYQDKAKVIKLRDEWVPVDPSEWRERTDMTVNIGLGIGTREQNLLHLNAIAEKQQQIVQAGGMNLVVSPKNIYNTCAELVKNANLKTPEMFFTDPGDKQAPPPSNDQEKLQAQAQQLEQRRQQLDATDAALKQQKIQLQAQEAALQHQKEMMGLEQKAGAQHDRLVVDMEKIRNDLTEMELKYNSNVPGSRV
jgi:DNA repair exonuclease SbcCD ATPase subunit